MRILIIEDDSSVAAVLKRILRKHYVVDLSHEGRDGSYKAIVNDYDLVLIDYMLPDMDGVEVCKQIRTAGVQTPIIFLTAKFEIRNRVIALNAGADDYMVKPFSSKELLARVRAQSRRYVGYYQDNVVSIDSLVLDCNHRTVRRNEKNIHLRRKAFDLLEYLVRNRDRVLTRGMILEHVWESGIDDLSNTVDVHIKYLRDKIDKPFDKDLIKTVHGMGYKISASE